MDYKITITSDLTNLDALKAEFSHAKRTLAKLEKLDLEFDTKHHKMTTQRVWLKDRIAEWKQKVATMDKIVMDFKNEEKARVKKEQFQKAKDAWIRGQESNNNEDGINE